ncbi:4-nitrophenyl phosphatase [Tumebacillus sp. BK434]|uniref:TIGR01457 family HAD-type hydrolase n=1 Tax=Tumebacillus sp. BK434 TaxID=2512169 RepID=UPI001049A483|nr:TIGR01457 family HAD-type hydrolase [Tumebacillus sp. BK434]TCP53278.1 4-nitrophenyl phosphatase [Tumebacillus sp. BK434]
MSDTAWLQETEAFLIDLDGTLYRGKDVIPDAPAFIRWLEATGRKYLYVTNNSSRRPEQVAEHLRALGIPAETEHVFTSSMVAAQYIKEHGGAGKKAFVIGEEGLRDALTDVGIELTDQHPDYVVQGIDRSFSYDKLKTASLSIQAGAVYLATNVDKALPTEQGLLPGAGSLLAAVKTASGADPVVMGKPEARMIDYAVELLGVAKERAVVVGDNLETDILAGVNAGVRTVLVLSGFSKQEHVGAAEGKPTVIVDSLTDLMRVAE